MVDLMLYAIWQPLPCPTHFPQDWRLDRLLASNYDPEVGQRLDHYQKGISLAA